MAKVADPKGVAEISARIERLPFSRWHVRALSVTGTAHFFDAFDSLAIAFSLPVLVGLWSLTPSEIGLLISGGYLGQLAGAFFFSWLAQRYGRRPALTWTIWIVSIFSLACAVSWNYLSFLIFRLVQGTGLGGEVPVASTYINEVSQARIRGRMVVLLQTCFALGILICSLIAVWLVPHFGWQSIFLLGAVPAVLAISLRRILPESPRWLAANGRMAEAEASLDRIETTVASSSGRELPPIGKIEVVSAEQATGWLQLVSREYVSRTVFTSIAMLCTSLAGYGLLSWMPTIYKTVYKLSVQQALNVSLVGYFAVFLGGLTLALVVDRIGRRPSFVIGFGMSAVTLVVLSVVAQTASLEIIVTLVSVGLFFITFLLTGAYLYAAEIYPTRIRALGTGLASAWFRIGSIVGPTIIGLLLTFGTISTVFLFFAAAAGIGAVTVLISFVETKGQVLEKLSH
ncbi:MFS transporter [Bradyrhizobium sp. CB82]|uniref:MFS transporter n=1 Tax=Bradyrhizobium sp. CB82 TaxID=3039159 RepID=UPI0024B14EFB|nr:MFS transporter [Bradyrhizobium sp. CB82]WFU41517.1 MFS transporter [Bradyrhizobium sp. CB82]